MGENVEDVGKLPCAWENARPVPEQARVESALAQPHVLDTTLTRLYGKIGLDRCTARLSIRYLATGGAKRVYLVTALSRRGDAYSFVLKQFLSVKLGHLPPLATVGGVPADAVDLDDRLLDHMVWAARRLDDVAPGLCPRFGGLWRWLDERGQACRAMTEAYVEGHSLDHWKGHLEERFIQGDLDFARYTAQRYTLERQGIAAYLRLWAGLGCRTFTSDPSPWNVLLTPTSAGLRPTIIDLHSIHDGGTPLYVFQTLEDMFGNRDEVRESVLCPGVLDALGRAAGLRFLEDVRVALAAAESSRARVGLSSFVASVRAIERFLASLSHHHPDPPVSGLPQVAGSDEIRP